MGLSFLNKKKVHPGSFGNIEDVWKRENEHREDVRKLIENEKRLKEERQAEELMKLKVEAGLVAESELEKLPFIYKECTDFSNKNIKTTDDFFSSIKNKPNPNEPVKKQIKPLFEDEVSNPKNEMFTRIHEDPLYLIKKQENNKRREIEDNPYQMKIMLREIEEELLKEENKVKKSKKLKDKHREKKHKKEKEILISELSKDNKDIYSNEENDDKYEMNLKEKDEDNYSKDQKYGLFSSNNKNRKNIENIDFTGKSEEEKKTLLGPKSELLDKIKQKEELYKKYTTNYSNSYSKSDNTSHKNDFKNKDCLREYKDKEYNHERKKYVSERRYDKYDKNERRDCYEDKNRSHYHSRSSSKYDHSKYSDKNDSYRYRSKN